MGLGEGNWGPGSARLGRFHPLLSAPGTAVTCRHLLPSSTAASCGGCRCGCSGAEMPPPPPRSSKGASRAAPPLPAPNNLPQQRGCVPHPARGAEQLLPVGCAPSVFLLHPWDQGPGRAGGGRGWGRTSQTSLLGQEQGQRWAVQQESCLAPTLRCAVGLGGGRRGPVPGQAGLGAGDCGRAQAGGCLPSPRTELQALWERGLRPLAWLMVVHSIPGGGSSLKRGCGAMEGVGGSGGVPRVPAAQHPRVLEPSQQLSVLGCPGWKPHMGQEGALPQLATGTWSPPSAPGGTRGLPRVLAPRPSLGVPLLRGATDTNVALAGLVASRYSGGRLAERWSLVFGPQGTGWMSSERSTL